MVGGTHLLILTVLVAAFVVSSESAILITRNGNSATEKPRNETSESHKHIEEKAEDSMKTVKGIVNHQSTPHEESEEAFAKRQEQLGAFWKMSENKEADLRRQEEVAKMQQDMYETETEKRNEEAIAKMIEKSAQFKKEIDINLLPEFKVLDRFNSRPIAMPDVIPKVYRPMEFII